MAERLTDEELGELEHAASCADGCDCDCGPSRAAFTCADNVPRLIAEVRELRAEVRRSRDALLLCKGNEACPFSGLVDLARADERAKVEREIVEWIRDETAEADYGQGVARLIIDAIERGEHRR